MGLTGYLCFLSDLDSAWLICAFNLHLIEIKLVMYPYSILAACLVPACLPAWFIALNLRRIYLYAYTRYFGRFSFLRAI